MRRLPFTEGNYAAVLAGSKTQTRRQFGKRLIERLAKVPGCECVAEPEDVAFLWTEFALEDDAKLTARAQEMKRDILAIGPYAVGDTVALTLPHWRVKCWRNGLDPIDNPDGIIQIFDAVTGTMRATDGAHAAGCDVQKEIATGAYTRKAARYMPVWACLHVATIQAVRAERLGEISDEDCAREGLYPCPLGWRYPGETAYAWPTPADAYRAQWEALHGTDNWSPNEWVWVIDFDDVRPFDGAQDRETQ